MVTIRLGAAAQSEKAYELPRDQTCMHMGWVGGRKV